MDASILVALVAGAAGGGLLIGGRALAVQLDQRPCWQKNDCALRRSNPEACEGCPVYVYRDVPTEAFITKELNLPPLRNFEAGEAAKAA